MNVDFAGLERAEQDLRVAIRRVGEADGGKLFPLDFLAWAAANRTMALIHGFRALVTARNFITAASLVRLQLDTTIRFKAAWHVDNPHDFASRILKGARLDRLKDRHGNRLTDAHLVSLIKDDAPWAARVYRETSGFVHLSQKHIFASFGAVPEEGDIELKVSPTDPSSLTDVLRQEAVDGFCALVALLVLYLEGWAATKGAPASDSEDAEST